ncbi:unnamed protein product [Owenia fusiformis]|uniref:Uncharacterized protein n=1 Tax=Owenia fusiformis TaxID=6347 RepID=A0A8S4NBR8_OWEFU|nr:unnamed protein product [Owenia fusiformis]
MIKRYTLASINALTNSRYLLTKWRMLIAGMAILIILMYLQRQNCSDNLEFYKSLKFEEHTRRTGEMETIERDQDLQMVRGDHIRTISEDEMILEKYKKYTRTHNITVTMFTTFSDREEKRYAIQNNTILNWLHLQNVHFKLVLFSKNKATGHYHLQRVEIFKKRLRQRDTNKQTQEKKMKYKDIKDYFADSNALYRSKSYTKNNAYYQTWDIIPLDDYRNLTTYGRPILKQMYLEVQKRYHSDLYMYVNGDILFHAESLLQTLYGIKQFVDNPKTKKDKWLIFGGRREAHFYNTDEKLTRFLYFGDDAEIKDVSFRAQVLNHNALDFFICGKNSFPWVVVPDFVVSLLYFDHWLVLYSNKVGIETFDITDTSPAVHQNGVSKVKDYKYAMADDLNTFLFKSAIGVKKCTFDNNQAKLDCTKQKSTRLRVGEEEAIVVIENSQFNTIGDVGCIYPCPLMAAILGPMV